MCTQGESINNLEIAQSTLIDEHNTRVTAYEAAIKAMLATLLTCLFLSVMTHGAFCNCNGRRCAMS